MKFNSTRNITIAILTVAWLAVGCTKRYEVTNELYSPPPESASLSIGSVSDNLSFDTPEDKKPTREHISLFKEKLVKRISKKNIFAKVTIDNDTAAYELSSSINEYREGSGFMRFMFGLFAGSSKLDVTLELFDRKNGQLVFGGDYTGSVSGGLGLSKGESMFDSVAKDFTKSLDKAIKKQKKQKG